MQQPAANQPPHFNYWKLLILGVPLTLAICEALILIPSVGAFFLGCALAAIGSAWWERRRVTRGEHSVLFPEITYQRLSSALNDDPAALGLTPVQAQVLAYVCDRGLAETGAANRCVDEVHATLLNHGGEYSYNDRAARLDAVRELRSRGWFSDTGTHYLLQLNGKHAASELSSVGH